MSTVEITEENFESVINGGGIVLYDFWAEWCAPCRQFGPIFEKASEDNPDIVFGKVDTEAQPGIAQGMEITSIPTLMAFRDGIGIFREAGALPGPVLEDLIKQIRELDMDEVRAQLAAAEAAEASGDAEVLEEVEAEETE